MASGPYVFWTWIRTRSWPWKPCLEATSAGVVGAPTNLGSGWWLRPAEAKGLHVINSASQANWIGSSKKGFQSISDSCAASCLNVFVSKMGKKSGCKIFYRLPAQHRGASHSGGLFGSRPGSAVVRSPCRRDELAELSSAQQGQYSIWMQRLDDSHQRSSLGRHALSPAAITKAMWQSWAASTNNNAGPLLCCTDGSKDWPLSSLSAACRALNTLGECLLAGWSTVASPVVTSASVRLICVGARVVHG